MSNIKITMKDGTVHDFPHEGRAGGSYTKTLSVEGPLVTVTDEWGNRRRFPVEDIQTIDESPVHRPAW